MNATERLAAIGTSALTDAEILSALIFTRKDTKKAEQIIHNQGGNLMVLARRNMPIEELSESENMRISLVREVMFRYPLTTEKITSPRAASEYLIPKCRLLTEEVFGMLALDVAGNLIADRIVFRGSRSATTVCPSTFFRTALAIGAASVIAYHNHPSGNVEPSTDDELVTKKLRRAGDYLNLQLADHIIVGSDDIYSFRRAQEWK